MEDNMFSTSGLNDETLFQVKSDIATRVTSPTNPRSGYALIFNPSTNAWESSQVDSAGIADGSITSAKILDGTIVNADVNASAAIAYSKLNLASSITSGDIVDGTIVNADISTSAAISRAKVDMAAGRAQQPNGAANTSAVAFVVQWVVGAYQNSNYVVWNGATALSGMVTGTYNVTACLIWPSNVTGMRQVGFRYSGATNGGLDTRMAVTGGFATVCTVVEQRRLTAGDYVEVVAVQTSGGSLPPTVDGRCCMTLEYIGP